MKKPLPRVPTEPQPPAAGTMASGMASPTYDEEAGLPEATDLPGIEFREF